MAENKAISTHSVTLFRKKVRGAVSKDEVRSSPVQAKYTV